MLAKPLYFYKLLLKNCSWNKDWETDADLASQFARRVLDGSHVLSCLQKEWQLCPFLPAKKWQPCPFLPAKNVAFSVPFAQHIGCVTSAELNKHTYMYAQKRLHPHTYNADAEKFSVDYRALPLTGRSWREKRQKKSRKKTNRTGIFCRGALPTSFIQVMQIISPNYT